MAGQRTREEIDGLKAAWASDPSWDIEETAGFEAHREELTSYHAQMEVEWERRREQQYLDAAARAGVHHVLSSSGGDARVKAIEVGRYILRLEYEISALRDRVARLEEGRCQP